MINVFIFVLLFQYCKGYFLTKSLLPNTYNDGDMFGSDVSIYGDDMIVGSPGNFAAYHYKWNSEHHIWDNEERIPNNIFNETDIGALVDLNEFVLLMSVPFSSQSGILNSGTVYIFYKLNAIWSSVQALTASDASENDRFGESVSQQTNYIVVGAPNFDGAFSNSGKVYLYEEQSGVWQEIHTFEPSTDYSNVYFGKSVSISSNWIAVGASGVNHGNEMWAGSVFMYEYDGSNWLMKQELSAPDKAAYDGFGTITKLYGNTLVVTAPWTQYGTVYIFELNNGQWNYKQRIFPVGPNGNNFGSDISIYNDKLLIGYRGFDGFKGRIDLYLKNGNSWVRYFNYDGINHGDQMGKKVSVYGDHYATGLPFYHTADAGRVFFFREYEDHETTTPSRSPTTKEPTVSPTKEPTNPPTTPEPTTLPISNAPTPKPTFNQRPPPTKKPTNAPVGPTEAPVIGPTEPPTERPSRSPTESNAPSMSPVTPAPVPTEMPTIAINNQTGSVDDEIIISTNSFFAIFLDRQGRINWGVVGLVLGFLLFTCGACFFMFSTIFGDCSFGNIIDTFVISNEMSRKQMIVETSMSKNYYY